MAGIGAYLSTGWWPLRLILVLLKVPFIELFSSTPVHPRRRHFWKILLLLARVQCREREAFVFSKTNVQINKWTGGSAKAQQRIDSPCPDVVRGRHITLTSAPSFQWSEGLPCRPSFKNSRTPRACVDRAASFTSQLYTLHRRTLASTNDLNSSSFHVFPRSFKQSVIAAKCWDKFAVFWQILLFHPKNIESRFRH